MTKAKSTQEDWEFFRNLRWRIKKLITREKIDYETKRASHIETNNQSVYRPIKWKRVVNALGSTNIGRTYAVNGQIFGSVDAYWNIGVQVDGPLKWQQRWTGQQRRCFFCLLS